MLALHPAAGLLGCFCDPRRAVSAPCPPGTALPGRSLSETNARRLRRASRCARGHLNGAPCMITAASSLRRRCAASGHAADRFVPSPASRAGQDPHRLRRRLDEERARRHQRRLHQSRPASRSSASYAASSALMKQIEQGAPADVFVSADLDWMDYGVAEEGHQGRHARQPARQQAGADRAEGFQDRQRRRSARASISPSSPATAASRPATCARCRSANTPRRRWRSSAPGTRPSRNSRWPRTCAPRSRWWRAARRRSASSTRPTPRSSRA